MQVFYPIVAQSGQVAIKQVLNFLDTFNSSNLEANASMTASTLMEFPTTTEADPATLSKPSKGSFTFCKVWWQIIAKILAITVALLALTTLGNATEK